MRHPDSTKLQVLKWDRSGLILCSLILVAFSIFISIKNIGNPFFWDDYHLIRSHTRTELVSVWTGNWDSDKIETPGYRPLTIYFNDLRYRLFGENVVAHRIFLIALFDINLILWGLFLRKLGLGHFNTLCISLLILSARNSAYHFSWISDGIHLFQGLLFVVVIWLIHFFVHAPRTAGRYGILIAALGVYLASLLVREESVIILGASTLLWWFMLWTDRQRFTKDQLLAWVGFSVISGLMTLFVLLVGKHFVPGREYDADLQGIVDLIRYTIFLPGLRGGYPSILLAASSLIIASLTAIRSKQSQSRTGSRDYWLFGIFIMLTLMSCLPGIYMSRTNLTYFSTLFYCSGLGVCFHILIDSYRGSRWRHWVTALILLVFIPILSMNTRNSILLQESTAKPVGEIIGTLEFIWGSHSDATVPQGRRDKVIADLENLGITRENYKKRVPTLLRKAYEEKRFHPDQNKDVFFPEYLLFSDEWGYDWIYRIFR